MSITQLTSTSPRERRIFDSPIQTVIAIACAMAVVGALVWAGVTAHADGVALTDCRAASAAADEAWDKWDKARDAAIAQAKGVDKADVSDVAKVLEPVAKPAALGARPTHECAGVAGVTDFVHAAGRLRGVKADADGDAKRFSSLADDIKAKTAVLVKDMDATALKALNASIGTADELVRSSQDKVADGAVRDTLSEQLDAARKTAGAKGDGANARAYKAGRARLDAAIKAVNDSMDRKAADDKAEAEAEAEAEAAQAQAAPAQPAPAQAWAAPGGSGVAGGWSWSGGVPQTQPQSGGVPQTQPQSGGAMSADEIQRIYEQAQANLDRYAQACQSDPNSTLCAATRGQ